jgi:hypothetical protein
MSKKNSPIKKDNRILEDSDRKSTILKMREYSEEQFDKLIVTINGGALAITVGFVQDIVKISEVEDTRLLKFSWLCFVTSLLMILISHKTSIASTNFELKEQLSKSDTWDKITNIINTFSVILLILGLCCFMIFVGNTI